MANQHDQYEYNLNSNNMVTPKPTMEEITRPSFRWISSTDTYKPHLALIYAQMLERERGNYISI